MSRESDDLRAMTHWIVENADRFTPLDIASVDAVFDVDADGDVIIFVTLHLNPPDDGGPWPMPALLKLYKAVGEWARSAGFSVAPHVHVQTADLAKAG